ncbi:MAG: primosomal protein N' [bacterium]
MPPDKTTAGENAPKPAHPERPRAKRFASVSPLLVPVDKEYDYAVPAALADGVRPGAMVIVPFRNRKIFGIVTRLAEAPRVPFPKEVEGLVGDFRSLPPDLVRLCHWISRVFLCPVNQVFESVFPFQKRLKRYGIDRSSFMQLKRKTMLYKNVSLTDRAIEEKSANGFAALRRAKSKRKALETLFESGGALSMEQLLKKAGVSAATAGALERDGWVAVDYLPKSIYPAGVSRVVETPPPLFPDQKKAFDVVVPDITESRHQVYLLHGVTGSGKTEIYMHLAAAAIAAGKRVLILVPEIAMGTQIISRFLRRFSKRIAVWHSALSLTERLYEWECIASGSVSILVGARSAVLAPLENIGLIIVDEEQESAYKQESAPRYHGRYAAVHRARLLNCPVVLGSATPSIETFHMTRTGRAQCLHLPERIGESPMPEISIVDMRNLPGKRTTSVFSPRMLRELMRTLEEKHQSLVFLNHRGYAWYVQCFRCGASTRCGACAVPMKYHKAENALKCHYCGAAAAVPERCPACNSRAVSPVGFGTEKVFRQLSRFFSDARIERMDRDTTSRKGEYSRIIGECERGEIDVLVGTQMIAKGFDFPGVTFVGVVSADSIINMPDFRSSERTFHLLTQVAGRAGRGRAPGRAVIQTYAPLHPPIVAARDHDYNAFYDYEIEVRRKSRFPPFSMLVNFIIASEDQAEARDTAVRFAALLSRIVEQTETTHFLDALGPAEAPIFKLHNRYRWFLCLRSSSLKTLLDVARRGLDSLTPKERRLIHPDVFPENMM